MEKKAKKIAIISGGAGFVGSAIIAELAKAGWYVASLSLSDKIVSGAHGFACDITDEQQVQKVVSEIARLGKIGACIHAAASPTVRKPLLSLSRKEFDADVTVGLFGAFVLAKEIVPHMVKNAVFIGVTTASLEDKIPTKTVGSYIPAKAALRGFLRTLAQEVRQDDIRVNALAPGFIAGGLNRDLPEKIRDFIATKTDPEGVTLQEVAEVTLALCENNSAYPSGTSVMLPGKKIAPL